MTIVKKVLVRRVKTIRPKGPVTALQRQSVTMLDNETVRKFNPSVLELGNISAPCREKEAIAAVFDLTGFTVFCSQADAYLAIPRFLNDYLEWFFGNIKKRVTEANYGGQSALWAGLPMMAKFLGDGLLLLWNSQKMTEGQICRLAAAFYEICAAYRTDFYPAMRMVVNKPPQVLRCGVSRGRVFTIGDGKDYVGHCINTASRLSHVGALSFCFPHRGFQVQEHMPAQYLSVFQPIHISIRGIGESELVWVVKDEYTKLAEKNREMFGNLRPAVAGAAGGQGGGQEAS
ncbi:MAG: hypothetical protein A2137_03920 [Chloroflexi bacterium RBG_16_58_8]|nr:MAG: hypothetical protein A2137_03920 [Chloroflexi bacterium RBG_16_58_8]